MNDSTERDDFLDEDTLIAYALGMLDDAEAAHIERALGADPEAVSRLRAHLDALALLALSDEPSEVPAEAEAELLQRIRGGSGTAVDTPDRPRGAVGEPLSPGEPDLSPPPIITAPPRRSRPWLALVAALALLALGFGVLRPLAGDAWVAYQLRRYGAQQGAVSETLLADDGARLGVLIRLEDDRVVVALDEPPPAERVYQAWEIAEGADPQSRGIWSSRLFTSEPLGDGNLFGISVEPPGGSPQPTSAPIVVLPL